MSRVVIQLHAGQARHRVTDGRPACDARGVEGWPWAEVDEVAADDGSADGQHHPACGYCYIISTRGAEAATGPRPEPPGLGSLEPIESEHDSVRFRRLLLELHRLLPLPLGGLPLGPRR